MLAHLKKSKIKWCGKKDTVNLLIFGQVWFHQARKMARSGIFWGGYISQEKLNVCVKIWKKYFQDLKEICQGAGANILRHLTDSQVIYKNWFQKIWIQIIINWNIYWAWAPSFILSGSHTCIKRFIGKYKICSSLGALTPLPGEDNGNKMISLQSGPTLATN